MSHHRARMTPRGREMVVRRVVDDGMSFAQAAAWGNVSKSTVWEWVRRWRAATQLSESRWRVCLSVPVALTVLPPGVLLRRSSGSVSCASELAGVPGRSPC
jgi:transposase-like protein